MIDSIVIAGGKSHDEGLIRASGQDCKAMIEAGGKPVVWWVVAALKECRHTAAVTVVSRKECEVCVPNADFFVEEACDETDNLIRGIESGTKTDRVFMITGDMPLVTAQALNDFFDNAPDADIVYPVVERADVEREFAGRNWVYLKTPNGDYTGSSCFLFKRQAVLDRVEWVRKVFRARRSMFQLARMWGLPFILKFAFHKLTLQDAEAAAGRVLNLSGRAYISRYPEMAMDLDHADDLPIIRDRLEERGGTETRINS